LTTISKFEKRALAAFVNAGRKAAHAERIAEMQKENNELSKKDRKFKKLTYKQIQCPEKDRYRV
jgi:hypothetical protein